MCFQRPYSRQLRPGATGVVLPRICIRRTRWAMSRRHTWRRTSAPIRTTHDHHRLVVAFKRSSTLSIYNNLLLVVAQYWSDTQIDVKYKYSQVWETGGDEYSTSHHPTNCTYKIYIPFSIYQYCPQCPYTHNHTITIYNLVHIWIHFNHKCHLNVR